MNMGFECIKAVAMRYANLNKHQQRYLKRLQSLPLLQDE
jgi:hypothetical protein